MPTFVDPRKIPASSTPSHRSADSHEIRALTGIRGFAAVLVVVFHFYGFWATLFPWLTRVATPISRGPIGVDLFFILSGFILSYVYDAGNKRLNLPEFSRFLWFRLARIYPNHLAMLLFLMLLVGVAALLGITITGHYQLIALPFQLTLTHSWPLAPAGSALSWNYPSWSISAEWFAYLGIFPIVAFLLHRITRPAVALLLGFGVLEIWTCCISLPTFQPFVQDCSLTQVSCEFFAGGMFFSAFNLRSRLVGFCQRHLTLLFVVFLALLWIAPPPLAPFGAMSLLPLLLLGMTSEASLVSRVLCLPFMLWLGRVSYALYMSHGIAIRLIKILLPPTRFAASALPVRLLIFAGHLIVIALMAVALYYIVEIPSRNLLRKMRPPWNGLHRWGVGNIFGRSPLPRQ
jgi:peptidoglycan/LPS O-acetylase OafA/YrhL